jgi:hypothetical protein
VAALIVFRFAFKRRWASTKKLFVLDDSWTVLVDPKNPHPTPIPVRFHFDLDI